jgi:hypothetical protein
MPEPRFIEQTTITDDEEKIAWFKARAAEATKRGGVFFRASYHPDKFDLILFEGWTTWPQDQGEPRWQREVS